ncbi:hypothetical protein VTO73DRAFT_9881 [Trametes versicolor]
MSPLTGHGELPTDTLLTLVLKPNSTFAITTAIQNDNVPNTAMSSGGNTAPSKAESSKAEPVKATKKPAKATKKPAKATTKPKPPSAVRCSACRKWMSSRGGVHNCPGHPDRR